MPGICGIIGSSDLGSEVVIEKMRGALYSEPFYVSGSYSWKSLGIYVAWTNHRNSFCDCMPVWNEDRDIFLAFSGECFINNSYISELRSQAHQFESGNASYLVHLYEEYGIEFLKKLGGSFSGLLVDLRVKKAFLFNDRFGLGRIYYYRRNDTFFFASESKVLLRLDPKLRHINYIALAEYFSCGCTLQYKTLYSNISFLQPASLLKFDFGGNIEKDFYVGASNQEGVDCLDSDKSYRLFKDTWRRILPQYLSGNVGVSLTGGKDSRMIMAWANRPPGTLPCYTFGGMYRESVDVKLARAIARISEQPHHVINLNQTFLNEFPKLAEETVYITDGAMDVSGAADLYLNRAAREIAPIRVTGNYGQELLRADVAFKPMNLFSMAFQREFVSMMEKAKHTYNSELSSNKWHFVMFKQFPWHHYSRFALETSQLCVRSPFLDSELIELVCMLPDSEGISADQQLSLISEGRPALAGLETDKGISYKESEFAGHLKHIIQEFTFKTEYLFDYGMPQCVARFSGIIDNLNVSKFFLGRHKFAHFRIWYRKELSEYLRDTLLSQSAMTRPYLDRANIEKLLHSHINGTGNFTIELHKILTVELIHRLFLDQ